MSYNISFFTGVGRATEDTADSSPVLFLWRFSEAFPAAFISPQGLGHMEGEELLSWTGGS